MNDLEIIEFILHDERFEDTVLVKDHEITAEVKKTNFKEDFFADLRKMETPYSIRENTITITRKTSQELPDAFGIVYADDEKEVEELVMSEQL